MAVRRRALETVGEFDDALLGCGEEEDWLRRYGANGGRVRYLAAAGASMLSKRRVIAFALAAAVAWDLGLFAGRFYPFLEPHEADVPVTPTIAFLQAQPRPYRVAPMMNYMFPNSSALLSAFSPSIVAGSNSKLLKRSNCQSFG